MMVWWSVTGMFNLRSSCDPAVQTVEHAGCGRFVALSGGQMDTRLPCPENTAAGPFWPLRADGPSPNLTGTPITYAPADGAMGVFTRR